jgi:hypothetical protein
MPSGTDIFLVCQVVSRKSFAHVRQQVENTLYKLHRDMLTAMSMVFADMFQSGVPGISTGHTMDSTTDHNPIKIP